MKIVTNRPCFQGDLMFRRIDAVPATGQKSAPESGRHILAHSETGHHHVIESRAADRFIDSMNEFISYLSVSSETTIEHLRDFDTHEAWLLTPGIYEVRQQKEYVPEGFRRAED
jgi:hypothetical protein